MDEKKQTYDKIAAGKRIRECRKKLGFSRKKIAEKNLQILTETVNWH